MLSISVQKIRSNQSNSDQISGLNIARFICVLMVLVNHLNVPTKTLVDQNIRLEYSSPILALYSGYLLFLNAGKKKFVSKIYSRITTILLPYVAWISIYLILKWVAFQVVGLKQGTFVFTGDYSADFSPSKLIRWFILEPFVGPFWYLQNLMVVSLLGGGVSKIYKSLYLSIALLCVISICFFLNCPVWFSWRFLPFYLLGGYLSANQLPLNIFATARTRVMVVVFLFLIFVRTQFQSPKWIYFYDLGAVLVLASVLIEICSALETYRWGRYLSWFEKNSFWVFSSHMLVLSGSRWLIGFFINVDYPVNWFLEMVLYIIQFIFVLFTCILSGYLVGLFAPKVFRVLSGKFR